MLESLIGSIANHWIIATYLGTMALNESAILGAFSLLSDGSAARYLLLGLMATLGILTNDLILYGIAHFGVGRIIRKVEGRREEVSSIFEKVFLHNIFLSLLFLKFLVGIRTLLTIYLLAEKRVSLRTFILYDLCGIILYVAVLGILGVFIGQDVEELGLYHVVIKIAVFISALAFFGHILSFLFRKKSENVSQIPSQNS